MSSCVVIYICFRCWACWRYYIYHFPHDTGSFCILACHT
ncbi:hypothetical protein OIU76_006072 [Salix suchowensis]|nr:hypothetical protein OIU76_006072 [Salix suchowensis]